MSLRRLREGVARVVAYALPAYVVMTLTLVIHGVVAPWPVAQPLLARHADQVAVQVGLASGARRSATRGLESVKTRYYVLVPAVLREPELVRITQVNRGEATESRTRTGFFLLLAAFVTALVGSACIWLRPNLRARPAAARND